MLETAFALVQVIGDVGREVRLDAVLAHDDAVLLVAEVGGAKPLRAILLVDDAVPAQQVERVVDRAAVLEAALAEPAVVADAELLEVVADVGEDVGESEVECLAKAGRAEQRPGALDDGVDVRVLVALGRIRRQVREHDRGGLMQRASRALDQLVGDRAEVIAAIAIGWERELFAEALQVAQPHARGEDFHLPPGVVDVVLAVHVEAGGVEQVRERRAERRVPAVADVQRPRGIRGDELHHHLPAGADRGATVAAAAVDHSREFSLIGGGCEKEIDESGSRNLDAGHEFAGRQRRDDRLRQVARLAFRRLGELQRDVGREVAVGRVARALDDDASGRPCRTQFFRQGAQSVLHELFYQVFQGVAVNERRLPRV